MRNDEIEWSALATHRVGPDRRVAWARPPRARARSRRRAGGARAGRDPRARRLPRPSGARARARRQRRARDGDHPRPDQQGLSSRRRAVRRHPAGLSRRPLPLADRRAGAAARARGDRLGRRRHADGDPRPSAARLGRAVSSRVDRHRAWGAARRELHRDDAGAPAAAGERRARAAQHGRAGRASAGPQQRRRPDRTARDRSRRPTPSRPSRRCSATASTRSGWTRAASIRRCRASPFRARRWARSAPRSATGSRALG